MTTIRPLHPVQRQTEALYRTGGRSRPLVVELHTRCVQIHPKGLRSHQFVITYEQLYEAAARCTALYALSPDAKRRVSRVLRGSKLYSNSKPKAKSKEQQQQ